MTDGQIIDWLLAGDPAVVWQVQRDLRDGRWNSQNRHSGEVHFELEPSQPSRMNTLRALRVLRWVERATAASPESRRVRR